MVEWVNIENYVQHSLVLLNRAWLGVGEIDFFKPKVDVVAPISVFSLYLYHNVWARWVYLYLWALLY
jgi:hypothetical protein